MVRTMLNVKRGLFPDILTFQIFSSLYSMLPSAQQYLKQGGLDPSPAAWATIGCFLGGALVIQIFSRLLHHYIPSHVVDCDHSHEDEDDHHSSDDTMHENGHAHHANGAVIETTPLLSHSNPELKAGADFRPKPPVVEGAQMLDAPYTSGPPTRRPTLQSRLTTRMSTFVVGSKVSCDEGGPCYGYTEPCGHQCLKRISRSPTRAFGRLSNVGPQHQPSLLRTATHFRGRPQIARSATHSEGSPGVSPGVSPSSTFYQRRPTYHLTAPAKSPLRSLEEGSEHSTSHPRHHDFAEEVGHDSADRHASVASRFTATSDQAHHHHVPENAFLAIGLQTSIAIALHKLPEGFITYATNHANPQLGFSVFMALFIHNITEGFAMALPLYLAINSRWKAMFWSSLLGGVSQPLGAGVAALWFHLAGSGDMAPGDTVYGCMFSITSGIMASVALQLFSESLSLTHNRNICTIFAFIGMGILGVSHALTAR